MGVNASKDFPSDSTILSELNKPQKDGTAHKFSELLLDPIVKRKFDDLYQLIQHNSLNDINHLSRAVAGFQKERLPVLLELSKVYSGMLQDVKKMMPELQSDLDRFLFLGEDANLVKYFYWQSGSGSPSVATVLTGQESPEILRSLQTFVSDLRTRDAKMRYFQFKFSQSMLFQAAFAQTMWVLASAFLQSTQTFHRVRETAFGSVFKQLSELIQKYTGSDDVKLQDVDQLDKLIKKMGDVKHLANVREKLEDKKLTSIKDLLQDLIKMDSEISSNPGSLLPVPPAFMTGMEITAEGPRRIGILRPTGYITDVLGSPPTIDKFGGSNEEFQTELKLYRDTSNFLARAAEMPENEALMKHVRDSILKKTGTTKKTTHNNSKRGTTTRGRGRGRGRGWR